MSLLESIARVEHELRPLTASLPPWLATKVFSVGRTQFSKRFARERPLPRHLEGHDVTAWGLRFKMPLWNAAGMFKKGEAYDVVSRQGAGAYVAGTTTSRPREGNSKNGIRWPAAAFPLSAAAVNWLGLPNEGHAVVAARLQRLSKVGGCPVGASVAAQPGLEAGEALPELVEGMKNFDDAGVDFLELNESCPNTEEESGSVLDQGLIDRLEFVSRHFLVHRRRRLPILVKFGVDTDAAQLPELLHMLATLGYDGIIIGNTSTQYEVHRREIHMSERRLYDRFATTYGGGVSGRVVKHDSLRLSAQAAQVVRTMRTADEFHVIRCGGIEGADDLRQSMANGVLLHQWYTGYYEAFARHGHDVYRALSESLS